MKSFLKKLLNINKLEENLVESERLKLEAEHLRDEAKSVKLEVIQLKTEAEILKNQAEEKFQSAKEIEEKAKLGPKHEATKNKEPWVGVVQTHVNKENVRNGFFELDWNEYFIVQLKAAGYTGSTDEEIVDSWFQDLCRNVGAETGIDMDRRGSGYVNRALRDDGLTEFS
jgi:hypothetical protein